MQKMNETSSYDTTSETAAQKGTKRGKVMKKLERMLWTVVEDVHEGRLGLEQAAEKVCADPHLQEAVSLDLSELVVRDRERKEFLSERRAAGLKLDPATAEVIWWHVDVYDPYGIYDPDPDVDGCIGRLMFARAPGSKLWIADEDIPVATVDALRARLANELADGNDRPL
jgi:hypothetical protein